MTSADPVTFISHTNKPGGGELALRRYLDATNLPTRLITVEAGGVWAGADTEVVPVTSLLGLRSALRGTRLIVANSMRAAFLTALVAPRSSRLVYWVRDGLTDSAMSRTALALTKRLTAARVDHYLANSQWTAGTIERALSVDPARIDVVTSMCGVGASDLRRDPKATPVPPLRLLYLGRIASWKAPHVAVRALSSLRNMGVRATLTIAGGVHFGEDRYALELAQLVEDEPDAIALGHVDDVQRLLAQHDMLIHCSTVPEPFGQVIVQALAAGVPVIATDMGGPGEILADAPVPFGYPAADVPALVARVRDVLAQYPEVSRWATARAQHFTDDRLAPMLDVILLRQQGEAMARMSDNTLIRERKASR